jgi:hypothetical protein
LILVAYRVVLELLAAEAYFLEVLLAVCPILLEVCHLSHNFLKALCTKEKEHGRDV